MGGVYKPLSMLAGRPLIEYSLMAFEKSAYVKQIIITAPKEHFESIIDCAKKCGCTKLKKLVSGGETRAQSVKNAFTQAFDKKENITPFVAIHDAARPLITTQKIDKCFKECTIYGAAVCATRLRDAIKRAGNDDIATEILDRQGVWQMQTPQCFDTDIYHTCLATLPQDAISNAHDDAAIVMQAGFKVKCVETGFFNFKVTYPEDLELAEALLASKTNQTTGENDNG